MFFMKTAAALGFALVALSAVQAGQGDPDPKDGAADDKSRAAVDAWLRRIMTSDGATDVQPVPVAPKVVPIDEAVRRVFPEDRFYSVRFLRYPRAVMPPRPLALENLVCVRPDGSVDWIKDLDALKRYLGDKLPPVRDEAPARAAVLAYLRLAEEFYQDGHYTFTVPEDAISVSRQGDQLVASGKAVVTKGGKGEVTVTLPFDTSGKLKVDEVKIVGRVRPDVRLR